MGKRSDSLAARRRGGAPRGGNEFGGQIRSYTLSPERLIKDHRTGLISADADRVLDGEIDAFMEAELIRRQASGG